MAGLHASLAFFCSKFYSIGVWMLVKRCFGCCLFDFAAGFCCINNQRSRDKSMCTTDTESRQPPEQQPPRQIRKNVCNFPTYKRISSKRPAEPTQPKARSGRGECQLPTQKATWKAALSQQNQQTANNEQFGKRWSQGKVPKGPAADVWHLEHENEWGNLFGPAWLKVLK